MRACGGAAALQLGSSSLNLCQVFKVSKALPAAAENRLLAKDVVERLPTAHHGVALGADSKTHGGGPVPRQTLKEKLSPHFGVFGIFEGGPLHGRMTPRPVQHGGGVELARAPVDPKRGQCFALELTAEVTSSRRNSASWCIICRTKCSITCCRIMPSCWAELLRSGRVKRWLRSAPGAHAAARSCFSVSAADTFTSVHRLRVRSLNDPHDARLRPFNRHTFEPAAAASRCEPTHPSPSAC